MILKDPFKISARLMAGLEIDKAWIQLEYAKWEDSRQHYRWVIDLPGIGEFEGDDLSSGTGGGTLQEGFESLLSFLTAAGSSWNYRGKKGENSDLFPKPVVIWAADHLSDLEYLELRLEEDKDLIVESHAENQS